MPHNNFPYSLSSKSTIPLVLIISFLIVLQSTSQVFGQIEKDTLAGKFGSHTVWTQDLNSDQYESLDTSISNIYQYDPKYRSHDFYQDLGAYGTAYRSQFNFGKNRSVFKELSEDHFEDYGFKNERKFYKTYSPYARLNYDLGGIGDVFFDGMYTRNVTRTSNVGFQFRRMISKGVFPVIGYNQQANSTSLRFFGSTSSKNGRYKMKADYYSINYQAAELGGINLDTFSIIQGYYQWGNLSANMDANSRYEGRHYYLSHAYSIDSSGVVKVFHQLDAGQNKHKFVDDFPYSDTTETVFYPDTFNSYLRTFDQWEYYYIRNQLGLTGEIGKVQYKTSFHQRTYQHKADTTAESLKQEVALEISGGLNLNDSTRFNFDIIQSVTGAFKYRADLKLNFLEASAYSMNSLPYLVQERFRSNHFSWTNQNLKNTTVIGMQGYFKSEKKLKVGFSYDIISNYTYWDENWDVVQESAAISILSPELFYKTKWKRFGVETHIKYNVFTGNKVLGLPDLNGKFKTFYDLKMFKGALQSNIGAEIRTYSDYRAYGYMPVFHGFYNQQNGMKSYANPWLNGFFDFKIKTVRMFVRGENLLQYLSLWNFQTPDYPNKPINFSFGVEWRFYD